jgi:hypothetical protein
MHMSASNRACKDLLKDTGVLQDNIMDYKSDIDNLKSIIHSINNRQIAEANILTINKFSSKCVVTKEEFTYTIKRSNVVAGLKTIQLDFKKSTLHEIPTMINVHVVSKVEDNKLFSNPCTCKTSATKPENKDIIIGESLARGCAVRMNEYFSENVAVRSYVKLGVSRHIG